MNDGPSRAKDNGTEKERIDTAAGRLLRRIPDDDALSVQKLAALTGIREHDLAACREGTLALPPDAQMRLAAVIAEHWPAQRRAAFRLYGQAQASLRTMLEGERAHGFYPNSRFR